MCRSGPKLCSVIGAVPGHVGELERWADPRAIVVLGLARQFVDSEETGADLVPLSGLSTCIQRHGRLPYRSRAALPNQPKRAGSWRRRDNVKEAARNHATPAAGRCGVTAIRIGDEGERCVVSQGLDARIVELVPTQLRPGRANTAAIDDAR